MSQPEQQARETIDRLLAAAGWHVCDADQANIHAARGVAIREFPLPGFGFADYLIYVDGKAAGVIEAKKEGVTLSGVETQADRYTQGLPAGLPRWHNPLPFAYQSTGVETRFTNGLDPQPRSRPVFAFHNPASLAEWLAYLPPAAMPKTLIFGTGKNSTEKITYRNTDATPKELSSAFQNSYHPSVTVMQRLTA